jgi:acyl-CoA thioesterase
MTVKEINEKYKEINGYDYNNGIVIDVVDKEKVEAHIDVSEKSLNPWKIVHGGLLFSLADTAAGLLSFANGHESVTVDSNINYLKPCTKYAKCVATKVKTGKTISLYKVEIYNEKDGLLAVANMNYYNMK